jgi:hypothetical protein
MTDELNNSRLVWSDSATEDELRAYATDALEVDGDLAAAASPTAVAAALAELVEVASHGDALAVPGDGASSRRRGEERSGFRSKPSTRTRPSASI